MSATADVTTVVDVLFNQSVEQINEGHDAFTVVCALSPEHLHGFNDKRADWHHQYALAPHVRALILRELWEWKWSELHAFLEADDHAQTIGYDPDKFEDDADAPSYSAIYRAWNTYFGDDLKQIIEEVARHIRDYARESGNLLGNQILYAEPNEGVSERTQYRVKRRLAH